MPVRMIATRAVAPWKPSDRPSRIVGTMAEPRIGGERDPAPGGDQDGNRGRRFGRAVLAASGLFVLALAATIAGGWLFTIRSEPMATPSASPAQALVAVVDANGGLATMDEHGGSVVRYGDPGITFGFPAWSPDGTRIASVGQGPADTAIYVFNVPRGGSAGGGAPGTAASPRSGGEPTVVYRSPDHPPFYLYWAPDGRALSFLTTEPVGFALRIAAADGSGPPASGTGGVVRLGQPLYFDWVDPARLLVHVGTGADAYVGEIGPDGTSLAPTVPGDGVFRPAIVSHDGRYVAYARSTSDAAGEVIVAARDGSSQQPLPVVGPAAFVFDPTGDTLAAVGATVAGSDTGGFPIGPLRLVDPVSGAIRTLLDGSVVSFFWSPDGRTIAALRLAQPGDVPITAGGGVVLTAARASATPTVGPPAATAVRARLAFVDVETGKVTSEKVIGLGEDFVNLLLPYFDQYALSHRLWSPDGSSILLPLIDATGRPRVYVVPADGTMPRPVADGIKGFWSP
jgi:WD40-like Beta Propeller Repeat